ncbi:MAG TPA: DUF2339 domain-containing protein [Casimicrobiaceae bacterium]|nr:DUF2339 domain-containing protein [Casimicrobiaceae bacterium]
MWTLIGAVAGGLLGLALDDGTTAVAFAALGALLGWAKDGASRLRSAAGRSDLDAVLDRLAAVEARLGRIEQRIGIGQPAVGEPLTATPVATAPLGVGAAAAPAAEAPAAESPPVATPGADAPPPRPAYGRIAAPADAFTTEPARVQGAQERATAVTAGPGPLGVVRDWLVGGNTLTRVGIVILFFGVAFLLRYFAELVTVPIEAKLGAAAAGGLALAALGVRLARERPAYGLSLQGAGMGIVYLTVFAAFRLYEALPPLPSIVLLVATAGITVALALRHDSQALAALAFAGGFLAPVLIDTGTDAPALLFSWFAVLNAAVFAIAWRRAWRALNVLGFAFTFALGLTWGWSFYRPHHFATVQPFLALFFLFYVGIAILYARRSPEATAPVDGVLVFGVPLVGFALQAGIVRDFRYGEAWSAVLLAAFYAALWLALRRRPEAGLVRLAKAFAALAVVFATLAVPFALDARWTSAGWAIEAAAVYWLGVVQRQRLARLFAVVVEVAAAVAFLWDAPPHTGTFLANATFVGMALIGLAGLAIVLVADRHPDVVGPRERTWLWGLFAWGAAWWLAAGVLEMDRRFDGARAINASLAWGAGTALAALGASRALRWPRAAWLFVIVLPSMALAGAALLDLERTTLTGYGGLAWPFAWLVHAAGLRIADAGNGTPRQHARLRDLHVATAVALVGWVAWEASEWTGRATEDGTAWIACAAALPAVAYLAWVTRGRSARTWPLGLHGDAYGRVAGTVIAIALAAWFVGVNAISPGDPWPLPYLPMANPLDVTLLATLAVLWAWSGAWARLTTGQRVAAGAAGLFVALNGGIVRAAHHWGDVAWDAEALFAYRPLQVTLTLAWTVCALALMVIATRRVLREVWLAGAALLAVVVAKLFLLDLAALSGLTRVIAFLGVGALLLVIGWLAPLPPARDEQRTPAGT